MADLTPELRPSLLGFHMGVLSYIVLYLISVPLRLSESAVYSTKPCSVRLLTLLLALFSVCRFLVLSTTLQEHGLTILGPWTVCQWADLLVNVYFLFIVFWKLVVYRAPSFLETLSEVWLFTQDISSLIEGKYVLAFKFLTVLRMSQQSCTSFLQNSYQRRAYELTFGVLLVAGALMTAEEWAARLAYPLHCIWHYIYMTVITISTVGYGDMVPATPMGRVLVVVGAFLLIDWFMCECNSLIRKRKNYLPERTSKPFVVVLGCNSLDMLKELVANFDRNVAQVVVVVDEKVSSVFQLASLPKWFWIQGYLELKAELKRLLHNTPQETVLILADPTKKEEDSEVLLSLAMPLAHKARFVVQTLTCSQKDRVTSYDAWDTDRHRVVCLEILTAHLITCTVISPAAGPIFANLVTPAELSSRQEWNSQMTEFEKGETFRVLIQDSLEEKEDFKRAAIRHFYNMNEVLLGYVDDNGRYVLLPSAIPSGKTRIVLGSQLRKARSTSLPYPTDHHTYHIRETPSDISVFGEPGHMLLSALQMKGITHLKDDAPTTVIMMSQDLRTPQKIAAAKKALHQGSNPRHRIISNERLPEGVRPHCRIDVVSPAILMSATAACVFDGTCYDVWGDLFHRLQVDVEVLRHCTYIDLFSDLLKTDGLVAIGVQKGNIPVSVPSPDTEVSKGDRVVTLKMMPESSTT